MTDAEKKIEEFNIWYEKEYTYHRSSVKYFTSLIETLPKIEFVKGRVKSKSECIEKFKRKYLPEIELKDKDYQINDYLTDLIGIRVICLYTEDVQEVRKELKKLFREIEITDKSSQLEETEDKFGYKGLHLQLSLKKNLKGITDSERYQNIKFEIQIRTVIQDAWSILDHTIKYKKNIPQRLKRRINRLSALFEIAEDEFLNIQKEISQEERKINYRLKKGGRIQKSKQLDVFRFLFIALKYFPKYNFIESRVDSFVQEIILSKKDYTEGELNEAIQKHLIYVNKIEEEIKQTLNPYTKIRYCLYRANKKSFKSILSDHQRKIFQNLNSEN